MAHVAAAHNSPNDFPSGAADRLYVLKTSRVSSGISAEQSRYCRARRGSVNYGAKGDQVHDASPPACQDQRLMETPQSNACSTSGRRRRRRPDVEQALSKGKAFQAYQWTPVDLLFDRRHLT